MNNVSVRTTTNKKDYMVYAFMQELGLTLAVMQVYALLYSFTKGAKGVFYGTKKYLSDSLLVSERTVYKALKILGERELIEKITLPGGKIGIRCTEIDTKKEKSPEQPLPERDEKAEENALPADSEEKREAPTSEAVDGSLPLWTEEKREAAYKRIIINRYGRVSEDEESLLVSEYKEKGINAKSDLKKLGREQRVLMTEPQYKNLANMISADRLRAYIDRLEAMLKRNENTGLYCAKSHYRLLQKWIEEDMGI